MSLKDRDFARGQRPQSVQEHQFQVVSIVVARS